MEEIVQAFFNREIAAEALPIVLSGLLNTVLLSLLVVPLGIIGGLILALLAHSRYPAVRWPLMAWVDFFRQPILWRNIDRGFAVQGVYVVVLLAAAWANFATKDITS